MSIAKGVEEYFAQTKEQAVTVNDILTYLYKNGLSGHESRKMVRHAIYQKITRMAKKGLLEVLGKQNNQTVYRRCLKPKPSSQMLAKNSSGTSNDIQLLNSRIKELEYEVQLCIAEAKGYDELKELIPFQKELVESQKSSARERAIAINGQLTSAKRVLLELTK